MKQKTYLLTEEQGLMYRGQWVAFSGDLQRVVGHGKTPGEAEGMAKADNEEHAVLHFVDDPGEARIGQNGLPIWPCGSDGKPVDHYEQGLVCKACKKRFGVVFVLSNGTPHQHVASATCSECYKKAVLKNMEYRHAPAMLKWLDGSEQA